MESLRCVHVFIGEARVTLFQVDETTTQSTPYQLHEKRGNHDMPLFEKSISANSEVQLTINNNS